MPPRRRSPGNCRRRSRRIVSPPAWTTRRPRRTRSRSTATSRRSRRRKSSPCTMQFASPLPWWLVVLVGAGISAAAFFAYRRPLVPLPRGRRALLASLRLLSLAALVLFLCRPIVLLPPRASGDVVVPVLVDTSRSMRVADADGETRIARASEILQRQLLPGLAATAKAEVFAVGDAAVAADAQTLGADARRTDLIGALASIRDRYRGRRVAGIVL